ncbi:MAG: response regulator transcription factor, partial [Calditrichaeota bacterium]|nr:response regulator transcription factor [Calditrichota bacterium]
RMLNLSKQPYVFFLTAKTDEFDEILGLEIGADDYIIKPFSPRKISSKVKALFRRIDSKDENLDKVLKVGNIELNPQSHTVSINGEERKFLRKEFELLQFLMKRQGRVFSRADLLNFVWGEDVYFVDRTVDVHITKIRKKIDPYSHFIQTIQGVGYKLSMRH